MALDVLVLGKLETIVDDEHEIDDALLVFDVQRAELDQTVVFEDLTNGFSQSLMFLPPNGIHLVRFVCTQIFGIRLQKPENENETL